MKRPLLSHFCAALLLLNLGAGCRPAVKAPPKKPVTVSASERKEAEALYIQGVYAYAEGKTEEAIVLWKKGLALNPGHAKARQSLAEARAKQAAVKKLQ